jgi:RimJ/RimL family protein N-acetyltransferase
MKVLETDRLVLRWAVAGDGPFFMELLTDPDWIRYIGDRGIRTVEDAARYVTDRLIPGYEGHGFGLNVVLLRETGEPIGICGLIRREGLDDVDVGFAFLPRYRGRGYAVEATSAVLAHGRRAFGLRRIVAITLPENEGSIRVLEKAGMRREGAIRLPNDPDDLLLFAHEGDPTMTSPWNETVWRQFGASMDMLENAIRECPEKVWGDRPDFYAFWYLAYHTLFWLDYYASDDPKSFAPPAPFTLGEMDPAGVLPDRVYTKDELLGYLAHGREKIRRRIERMTEETAHARLGGDAVVETAAELLLYNMRHVQHHAAQLNLLTRQQADTAPRWVRATKQPLRRD